MPIEANKFPLKFVFTPEYTLLPLKLCRHTFSSRKKMEKYIKSEFFSIFQIKPVARSTVLWSLETHFMHIRVKLDLFISTEI